MKVHSFFLTLFLTICFSVHGQVDDFQKKIIECLNNNGTSLIYEKEYDNTLHILYKQFVSANAPDAFWEELRSDRSKKVDELIPTLAFAYRKHFTEEDIDNMNEFYKSESSQIWLDAAYLLNEEQLKEIDTFLETETGLKMISNETALKKDMDDIAIHWKRELFAEKMRALIKGGYTPQ